jgi:adenylate cyclase
LQQINPSIAAFLAFTFGLLVGTLMFFLPALIGVPVAVFASFGYTALALWAFSDANIWMPLAVPVLVQLPLSLFVGLSAQYLVGKRKQQKISKAFSYYLPDHLVADLTESTIDPLSVNRVVYGTCLATDMSGFTTLAESKSPRELASFMNAYFDSLALVLKRYEVDVTEFHADTIMSAWTAPERTPERSRSAVRAAIAVREAIARFADESQSPGLKCRIGLNDGQFYLGNTGGGGRFTYSILGDVANTAARLEGLNKYLHTQILAAESVVTGLDDLLVRSLGCFQLVGKADPVEIYEVMCSRESAAPDQVILRDLFSEALTALRSDNLDGALKLFGILSDRFPSDGPSRFHLNRCAGMIGGSRPHADCALVIMESK